MRRIFGKTATMLTVAMALALVAALACGAADEEAVATEVPGATVAPAADTAVPDAPVAVVQPTEAPMEEAEAGKYVPAPQVPGVYWDWRYTGPAPTTFQENPKFAELVKQGKLPPVEQRISDEPKVSAAPGGIGTYGGIFRNSGAGWLFPVIRNSMLYKRNSDEGTKIPHMMFWEVSDDGRVYTMRLRKGVKWGDGDPMDMEDVRFAWEDVNFNETLNPQLSPEWYDKVSGNRVKFAVVDDLHWSLTFETPDFSLMEALSTGNEACTSFCWWGASHYLKPYHEDYASAADIHEGDGRVRGR